MIRKFFLTAVASLFCCVTAFSLDPDNFITVPFDYMSREEYETTLDGMDESEVADFFMGLMAEVLGTDEDSIELEDFEKIEESDVDSEIMEMWDIINDSVRDSVEPNLVWLTITFKGFDENSEYLDGWFVFTHFNDRDDASCYVYYFNLCYTDDDSVLLYSESIGGNDDYGVDESLVHLEKIGNEDRKDFVEELAMTDFESLMQMSFSVGGFKIHQFAEIPPETMDEEDLNIVGYFCDRISDSASPNDIFVSMAFRNIDMQNYKVDGWFGLHHYIDDDDIETCLYYFVFGL